jgi:hypothetical protein
MAAELPPGSMSTGSAGRFEILKSTGFSLCPTALHARMQKRRRNTMEG